MTRIAIITLCLLVCAPPPALASNDATTLVMHAVETAFGPCGIPDPCYPNQPLIDVPAHGPPQPALTNLNASNRLVDDVRLDPAAAGFDFG